MAVNDFSYEPLSDYGVLTGEINYYMILQYWLTGRQSRDAMS